MWCPSEIGQCANRVSGPNVPLKIILATAPQSDPTQMHVAIPNLVASMVANGYPDTLGRDYSIGAYEHFLTPQRLKLAGQRVQDRLQELNAKPRLDPYEAHIFVALASIVGAIDEVVSRVDEALGVMRSQRFYDVDAYWWASQCLESALKLVSAEFFPWLWSMFCSGTEGAHDRLDGLLESAALDADANPFVEYYRARVIPSLKEENVDLLGISMVYSSQLIPGLALARLAKEEIPGVRIVCGGNAISSTTRALVGKEHRLPHMDFVCYSEGETSLLKLVQRLESENNDLSDVPNLRYFDEATGTVRETALHIEDLNKHPPPDFSGLSLDSYLSPTPVVTLDVTRGCYWGKCAFCAYGVSEKILKAYRERTIDRIVDDIRLLKEKWGTDNFLFSVDVLSPSFVRRLGERLIEENIDIHWMGDMRFEAPINQQLTDLMYASGCRFISCGLETASQRVANWMDKGTKHENVVRILQAYKNSKIGVNSQFFLGFPTETREEAQVTLDFVLENNDAICTVGFGHFSLLQGAAAEKNPERFGITEIDRGGCDNLSERYDYETSSGLTQAEAERLVEECRLQIAKKYPVISNMSLLIGAHGLLHLGNLGPAEFNRRIRGKACGLEEVGSTSLDGMTVVSLSSGTSHLSLRYDFFAMLNALKAENLPDWFEPRDSAVVVLYERHRRRCCRLSAEQADVVRRLNGGTHVVDIVFQQPRLEIDVVYRVLGALHKEGFVSAERKPSNISLASQVLTQETIQ